ncbi:MAG: cation-translocating P-type ATPase, partial [Gemmatimonadota bacterium]|nr:cation-translocating P-type ATPase [Gemmatimonadota bacterium]
MTPTPATAWHALDVEDVLERLATTEGGLDESAAAERRAQHGLNRLRRIAPRPAWRILVDQFTSVVVLLLVAASGVSFLLGDPAEGLAIAAVLIVNAGIGFGVELRARRAMDALLSYQARTARVRRRGELAEVPAEHLVPGDIIEIEEGDLVPADGRVLESSGLMVNEAPLTGESLPVAKAVLPSEPSMPIADRTSMAHSGTLAVGGRGAVIVTGTGASSEIGRIGTLLESVDTSETPLEARLRVLGHRLVGLTLGVAAVVSLLGVLRGAPLGLMLQTGIALAIAAVPEGLPAVATITLAVGLRRMAGRNALVRRLASVEALGSTTVVCTDKTGTLTAGQMTVSTIAQPDRLIRVTGDGYASEGDFLERRALHGPAQGDEVSIDPSDDPWLTSLLLACALTNRSTITEQGDVVGDPTDAALLVLARKGGVDAAAAGQAMPRVDEIPFDAVSRFSASIHETPTGLEIFVKGAPGSVIERSDRWLTAGGSQPLDQASKGRFEELNGLVASRGLRVIALARGSGRKPEDLELLGLVGILDPPAEGVAETVANLRGAGVRTVVITGDQSATAEAIVTRLATRAGNEESITGWELSRLSDQELEARCLDIGLYTRVSPGDKVRIVAALQRRGEVVAMIGDGANDAAALKKSDVGVAMGQRGTDVAKQAASIVLADDRFRTIGVAVEEGRVIFDNIRKFIFYLFSCNLAEVVVILLASVAGAPIPLLPLQILWLNLVTDTFPALALAMEPAEPGVMNRPPRRPEQSVLSSSFVSALAFYSVLIAASTLGAFAWGLRSGPVDRAMTIAFMTLALAQ